MRSATHSARRQSGSTALRHAKSLGHSVAREMGCETVMLTLIPGDWLAKPAEWLIPRLQPIANRVVKSSKQDSIRAAGGRRVVPARRLAPRAQRRPHANARRARTLAAALA